LIKGPGRGPFFPERACTSWNAQDSLRAVGIPEGTCLHVALECGSLRAFVSCRCAIDSPTVRYVDICRRRLGHLPCRCQAIDTLPSRVQEDRMIPAASVRP